VSDKHAAIKIANKSWFINLFRNRQIVASRTPFIESKNAGVLT